MGEIHINQRTNQNIAPINEAWNPGHTDIVKLLLAQVYILYIYVPVTLTLNEHDDLVQVLYLYVRYYM